MSRNISFLTRVFVVAALLSCIAAPVVAQKAKADSAETAALKKKAYGYFSKGELLFDSGDFIKAAEAFLLAYETLPHSATLLNVAICYEKADRPADAIEMYEKYLATPEAKDKDGREGAQKRIAELSKQAGELVISCAMPDCKVRIDGVVRGAAPITVKVSAGTHAVEALSRGVVVMSMEAAVRPGKPTRLDLKAMPGETSQPAPPPPPQIEEEESTFDETTPKDQDASGQAPAEKRHLRAPFWIASGVTVASAVVAIVFSAQFKSDVEKFEDSNSEDKAAAREGEKDMLVANVMWGVTGAAAVTAIVLGLVDLWPRDKVEPPAQVSFAATPAGASLGLHVDF